MKPVKKKSSLKIDPGFRSRLLLVLLVIALVALTMWLSGPTPHDDGLAATATLEPTLVNQFGKSTPEVEHPEIANIDDQVSTTGVIAGTILIVSIVFIGTLFSLWQIKDRSTLKKK